ncbi:MAG: site-specific integrase, partial [Nitrospirota bacterium]
MMKDLVTVKKAVLTAEHFQKLSAVPPEVEWLANITNEKTRRAYKNDVSEFSVLMGLKSPAELRTVNRAHVIAWRAQLEARELSAPTIRRKLSALSSLFDYLCERNAVAGNPVDGVKRPLANGNEGSTPPLSDAQAQRLIEQFLLLAGHGEDLNGPIFRPVSDNRTGELARALNPNSIYRNIVRKYGQETGLNIEVNGLCVHSMRATAATNALSH